VSLPNFLTAVEYEVREERARQEAKWGDQDHPDGTGGIIAMDAAEEVRRLCRRAFESGAGSWAHILHEEVWEAFAEQNPELLRAELIQVAATAMTWADVIGRRLSPDTTGETETG
jgi:hypothetical protein